MWTRNFQVGENHCLPNFWTSQKYLRPVIVWLGIPRNLVCDADCLSGVFLMCLAEGVRKLSQGWNKPFH